MPLSPKAAAARLGLSVGRVRQLITTGALRAVNVGIDRPVWAIDETELLRFAALDRPGHRPRKGSRMTEESTIYVWVTPNGAHDLFVGTTKDFIKRDKPGLLLGTSEEVSMLPADEFTARIERLRGMERF
jgi:hypothetical protein